MCVLHCHGACYGWQGRDICKYRLGLLFISTSRVEMGTIRHDIILRKLARVLVQRGVGWKVLVLGLLLVFLPWRGSNFQVWQTH